MKTISRERQGDEMDEESDKREDGRDWSMLPCDLIELIYKKLLDFLDCIFFRATFKAWNLSVPLSDATPRHPWIFDPYNSNNSSFRFYAFTSNLTISVPTNVPNCTTRRSVYHITSLGGGLLYLQHDNTTFQYSGINPLTNDRTALIEIHEDVPVPSHLPRVLWAEDGIILSVISASNECAPHQSLLTFYRIRNNGPLVYVQCLINGRHAGYEHYKKKYYINTGFIQATSVMDTTTEDILDIIPLPAVEASILPENGEILCRRFNYLIESSDDLLLIFAITYIRRPTLCRYLFGLHRLDDGGEHSQWVKMRGIGDRTIFLNEFDGFSLDCSDYPRLKKNSIYFMRSTTKRVNGDATDDNPLNNNRTVFVASRCDLETGLVEDFPYILDCWGSWYHPMLHD